MSGVRIISNPNDYPYGKVAVGKTTSNLGRGVGSKPPGRSTGVRVRGGRGARR